MNKVEIFNLNNLSNKIFYLQTRITQLRSIVNRNLDEELSLFKMTCELNEISEDKING
jgi:hypothetical protein